MHKVIILCMLCVCVIKYVFHAITWRNQSAVFVFEHSFLQLFECTDIHLPILYKYSIHMTTTHYFSFWKTNLKAELNLCYFWLIDQQGFIQFQFFCSISQNFIKGQPFNVRVNTSAIWFTSMTLLIAPSKKKPHWLKTTPR